MAYALYRLVPALFLVLLALAVAWLPGATPAQALSVPPALAAALPVNTCWLLVLLAGGGFAAWGLGTATDRMRPAG